MMRVAMLLWLGEMRVQRLISRRKLVALAQAFLTGAVLVFLAVRVHRSVVADRLAITNIAILS